MNGLRQLVARSDEESAQPAVVPPRTQFWSLNCSGFWHVDTNFVLFTYDLAGRRTKIKDPRGYETTFAYDSAYRLTSEKNAANNVTGYAYDLMSNMTGMTDALNRTTNYTHDDFNRLTKIKYPEATPGAGRLEENFAYDLAGNLLTKTEQAGRVTTFCYDNVNRITSTIDPAQKTTAFYTTRARNRRQSLTPSISATSLFMTRSAVSRKRRRARRRSPSHITEREIEPSERTTTAPSPTTVTTL